MSFRVLWGLGILLLAGVVYLLILPAANVEIKASPKARAINEMHQLLVGWQAYQHEYSASPGGSVPEILKALAGKNPREIVFWQPNVRKLSKDGVPLDPWVNPYQFDLRAESGSAIYSFGGNRKDDGGQGDDLIVRTEDL